MRYTRTSRIHSNYASVLLAVLIMILVACVEKMPLPSNINAPPDFSAGDTTYLLLNPVWDETFGFQAPIEISIAPDGHVFVADSAAHRIFALEQNGSLLQGFSGLANLQDNDGADLSPIDVDIDQKLNIFFIDGSRKVYRWNQLWNDLGIDSVADSATFVNWTTGDTVTALPGSRDWQEKANGNEWNIEEIFWSKKESVIDSLLNPHLFFDAGAPENEAADVYYASVLSRFSGVSAATSDDDFIYVTDAYHDRLVRINFQRSDLIKLGSQNVVWTHKGIFGHTVADSGRGAGTLNDPVAVDVDFSGNVYYSQTGNYFAVHKIIPSSSPAAISSSVFQEGVNEIMDLWDTTIVVMKGSVEVEIDTFLTRFSNPQDVAVDQKQYIYVANTGQQEIQVFNSEGNFFKKAGVTEVTVDTTLWIIDGTDTVAVDTFLTIEEKGFLEFPRALAVDDRDVIYVCDTPNSRVVRYHLSNALDENLVGNK